MNALGNLRKQFADSLGYTGSFNSKEFEKEFLCWLKIRLTTLEDYVFLLEELDVDFKGNNVAEIGKSCYDSIVLPFDSKIITPYYKEFINYHDSYNLKKRVLPGYFKVTEYGPRATFPTDKSFSSIVSHYYANTFMTQNPYENINSLNFDLLHNIGIYNIILGVYGNTYDKDYKSKLKDLMEVKNRLIDNNYMENFYNLQDEYFYFISSGPRDDEKIYSNVRTRS